MSSDQGLFHLDSIDVPGVDGDDVEYLLRDQCSGDVVVRCGSELVIGRSPIEIGANRVRLVQLSDRDEGLCAALLHSNLLCIYDGTACIARHLLESVLVLAVYWIHAARSPLLVVTASAFLFYHVNARTRTLNLVRAHTRQTIASWFLAVRRVLLAVDVGNHFDVWIVREGAPRKTLGFGIGRLLGATRAQIDRQVHLIDLYHHPTLVFVDESVARFHLYQIQRAALLPTHSFDLFHTGPARFLVSDHVLVVFVDGQSQLPLLFDTKAVNAPLISPLPVSLPSTWTILHPDLIVSRGALIKMSLRLDGLIDSWGISDPEPLIHFLTRRTRADPYIARVLRDQIVHERLSSQIASSFAVLAAVDPKRGSWMTQSGVVRVLGEVRGQVASRYLESVCFLYLEKLLEAHIAPEPDLVQFIVQLLVHHHRYHQLQQCLQYHMFPDSEALGVQLSAIGRDGHGAIYQLGLDILYRSGAHKSLVEEMLARPRLDHIVAALRFLSAHPELLGAVDPGRFRHGVLQALSESEDRVLVEDVSRWMQRRNLNQPSRDGKEQDGRDPLTDTIR